MHIFSHKTVQLFVRSLRGYTKSFLYWKGWLVHPGTVDFFPEMVDSFHKKVDCIQPSCFHSANDMYMKCINIFWRAQTYRLGFLRRKGRFVNRFLRVMKGWFLVSGILCRNFVVEIRETGADGSAQAGGNKSTGWKRIFEIKNEKLKIKNEESFLKWEVFLKAEGGSRTVEVVAFGE